jgi:hypothetical protein
MVDLSMAKEMGLELLSNARTRMDVERNTGGTTQYVHASSSIGSFNGAFESMMSMILIIPLVETMNYVVLFRFTLLVWIVFEIKSLKTHQ